MRRTAGWGTLKKKRCQLILGPNKTHLFRNTVPERPSLSEGGHWSKPAWKQEPAIPCPRRSKGTVKKKREKIENGHGTQNGNPFKPRTSHQALPALLRASAREPPAPRRPRPKGRPRSGGRPRRPSAAGSAGAAPRPRVFFVFGLLGDAAGFFWNRGEKG